ncbi:hypothetical protein ABZ419_03200 [Streptomyces cinnamoneus]|uniref:hypothetical protein n=1 Tax=Streptomyces cinnamoneus TaxID=53446 RepID=UPI0033E1DEE6
MIDIAGYTTLATIDMVMNTGEDAYAFGLLLDESGDLYQADGYGCTCCNNAHDDANERPVKKVQSLDALIRHLDSFWVLVGTTDKTKVEQEIIRALQVASEHMFRARAITFEFCGFPS